MVGTGSIIPTRSKQQALDWSLALLSQGIESAVEVGEEGQWQISVDPAEFGRAARVLRLYHLENRRLPGTIEPSRLLFDWGQTWFFALLVLMYALSATTMPLLRDFGMMSKGFFAGEWWRPFTAVLLHQNGPHLIANVGIGMLFSGLAGGQFGAWRAFLLSYAAGVIAFVIGAAVQGDHYHALGASGMVMGALGLLTSFSLMHLNEMNKRWLAIRGIAGGLLLPVLLGLNPNPHTDVLAHLTGFFFGLLFGSCALCWERRRWGAGVSN